MSWKSKRMYALILSQTLAPEIFNQLQENLDDIHTKEFSNECYFIFSDKNHKELAEILFRDVPHGSNVMLFLISDPPFMPE